MTTIRRFCCNDLLRFASVNLDHLTETFNMSFYMTYLARWPDYFHVAEGPGNRIMGYIMGKVEGQGESWHGHVTAVTVAPEYRRQQLAKKLMNLLEDISDKIDKAYFVDLFVRASNTPAIKMYEKLGYVIYRRVLRYYSGEEDGLDMRKALSRDVEKKSIIPLKRPVTPDELEDGISESFRYAKHVDKKMFLVMNTFNVFSVVVTFIFHCTLYLYNSWIMLLYNVILLYKLQYSEFSLSKYF
ncbi:N-terminal acetyltransferase B complex catalytic subunit NAA20 isoform X1 [Gossypium arboreum]|uniref:N-terminal acetyltransferase B complex catalytic subunit NAA20 isoform X1 n=1 Tax=Gossypium arboreum TaxID=29729 RepID=UPI0022F16349|nr:N-terminal acetyltransferase B complex catalytic subunit NAA20 isoform X1 [Gossypium arboreum]